MIEKIKVARLLETKKTVRFTGNLKEIKETWRKTYHEFHCSTGLCSQCPFYLKQGNCGICMLLKMDEVITNLIEVKKKMNRETKLRLIHLHELAIRALKLNLDKAYCYWMNKIEELEKCQ